MFGDYTLLTFRGGKIEILTVLKFYHAFTPFVMITFVLF